MSSGNAKKRDKNTFRYVLRNPPTSNIVYVRAQDEGLRSFRRRTTYVKSYQPKNVAECSKALPKIRSNASKAKRTIKSPWENTTQVSRSIALRPGRSQTVRALSDFRKRQKIAFSKIVFHVFPGETWLWYFPPMQALFSLKLL